MRGLVFGNSHVGAVLLGAEQIKEKNLDFYGILGGGGPNVKFVDGLIFPNEPKALVRTTINSADTDGLDLSPYDFIVFTSLGFGPIREEHPWSILRKIALAKYRLPSAAETLSVSAGFMEDSMGHIFKEFPGVAALRNIRNIFDGRIFCAPLPLPVMSKIEGNHPLRRIYGIGAENFITWYASVQLKLMHDALYDLMPPVTILSHPNPTWVAAGSLPEEYIDNNGDPWHTNARYGALLIEQVRSELCMQSPTG